MIPESNILTAIGGDLWIEKFPQNNTTTAPKGLIKRISQVAVKTKGAIVSGQYNTRINILWYDVDTTGFDTKMQSVMTAIDGIRSDVNIRNVIFEGRDDGYDDTTDLHVMNLEYIVKHNL